MDGQETADGQLAGYLCRIHRVVGWQLFQGQLGDSRIQFEDVHLRELAATETDDVKNKMVFITAYNSGNLSSSQ